MAIFMIAYLTTVAILFSSGNQIAVWCGIGMIVILVIAGILWMKK